MYLTLKIDMYRFTFFTLFFLFFFKINAQNFSNPKFSFKAAVNYNTIIDKGIVKNKKDIITPKIGVSVKFNPFDNSKKIFVLGELILNKKGYTQSLVKTHKIRLTYITLPIFIGYEITKKIETAIGFQYGSLQFTNVKAGKKKYNNNEYAVAGIVSYNISDVINIYAESIYSLNTVIDYYNIDKYGNFTSKINPFNNFQTSLGIQIKI